MAGRFAMVVEDMFHITGRGTVFTGVVRAGPVGVGDRVVIRSPAAQLIARVAGIERNRELRDQAGPGESVALFFREFDPHRVADGLDRTERGIWTVRNLRIESGPRLRWRFPEWIDWGRRSRGS
jgi:translation elongation factor EF-Tu-like GTPase